MGRFFPNEALLDLDSYYQERRSYCNIKRWQRHGVDVLDLMRTKVRLTFRSH